MFKRCVFIIVAVLSFSVVALASLSTEVIDETSVEEVQSGILDSADFITVEEEGEEVAYYGKRNRRHRRNNRGYHRGNRRHNRGYHRGHRRNRGHHRRRPIHGNYGDYVCYSQSHYTGQQFWGAHPYSLNDACWLANNKCYQYNSHCSVISYHRNNY